VQEDAADQHLQLGFNMRETLIIVRDAGCMPSMLSLTWVD
jgi:hypothetical protein